MNTFQISVKVKNETSYWNGKNLMDPKASGNLIWETNDSDVAWKMLDKVNDYLTQNGNIEKAKLNIFED